MGRKYVAITDNADPMNVVVYWRAPRPRQAPRVCEQPVFKGRGATENSLIGTATSLIVENNYGYGTAVHLRGADNDPRDRARRREAQRARVPNGVEKQRDRALGRAQAVAQERARLTTEAGGSARARQYLTAVSFRTGKTVWRKLVGTGFGFNNNYAGLAIQSAPGVLSRRARRDGRGRRPLSSDDPPRSTRRRMRLAPAALVVAAPRRRPRRAQASRVSEAEALGRGAYRYGLPLLSSCAYAVRTRA